MMRAYSTTAGWYKFGNTASPMAISSPSLETALTYRVPCCTRKGETGKLRPCRICPAVNGSTYTLGNSGSMRAAETQRGNECWGRIVVFLDPSYGENPG